MRDDDQHTMDAMDTLLRDAMAAPPPRLSPDFTAEVLGEVRPRRLSPRGRTILAAYALTAVVVSVWMLRDVPAATTALGAGLALVTGLATRFYARRIV